MFMEPCSLAGLIFMIKGLDEDEDDLCLRVNYDLQTIECLCNYKKQMWSVSF